MDGHSILWWRQLSDTRSRPSNLNNNQWVHTPHNLSDQELLLAFKPHICIWMHIFTNKQETDNSPLFSCVSVHLLMCRVLTAFYFILSFQGCLYSERPWMREIMSPPEQRVSLSTAHHKKDSGSLHLQFLSYNTTHCLCGYPSRCTHVTRLGDGGKRNQHTLMLILIAVLWVIKPFVSDSGVLFSASNHATMAS